MGNEHDYSLYWIIYNHNPYAHLIVYLRKYSDDIIIWDGPPSLTAGFVKYCNTFEQSFTRVRHGLS